MAYPVFTLPSPAAGGSYTWPIKRTPKFATIRQTPASLRGQLALSLSPYPIWEWSISLGYLKGNISDSSHALNQFVGFYLLALGSSGLFLFADPFDSSASSAVFGTGDGATTAFPLRRQLGASGLAGWDLIQNLNGTPSIYVAGTLTTPTSISSTGVVTFSSAPVSGAALTWTGSFYYLCRFTDDSLADLSAIQTFDGINLLWDLKAINLESVLL
ncbi:MAG: DUF2460 domain-containing protein [Terriglobales bacterium]